MTELWLIINTEGAEAERILVDRERFVIGRHSGSDLSINNSSISREHAKIERFGDIFVISDSNSTFGTNINGTDLTEPASLKDGDALDLGNGAVKIEIELIVEKTDSAESPESDSTDTASASVSASGGSTEGSSIPRSFFFIAPIFGIVMLLAVGGGLFYAFSEGSDEGRTGVDRPPIYEEDDSADETTDVPPPKNATTPAASDSIQPPSGNAVSPDGPKIETPPPPKSSSDMDKVRAYSASFLSRITARDKNAFLLDRQIEVLMPIVDKFKASSALADNLKNAGKNSARISAIANESGLQPQFLAAAALAKLGTNRGDVVRSAESMAKHLGQLQKSFGNELADEVTVVIAAYDQGAAGNYTQLRGQAEALSGKTQGVTARQVRTIWFLHDQGKLTDAEFDLALRFLAIGTIMQKPEDFNVKAEAVILN